MSENFALKRVERTSIGNDKVSFAGVKVKTLILLAIMVCAMLLFPYMALGNIALIGIALTGFVIGLVVIFKQSTAPYLSPVYAALQGLVISFISSMAEQQYQGIAVSAAVVTIILFTVVLTLYKKRILKTNENTVLYICGALLSILVLRLVDLAMGGALIPASGFFGIGIQAVVVGVATYSFILDFKEVEKAVEEGLEKRHEWYLAFGLLVGIIWLYLEVLRLLRTIKEKV
ncbi:Bax inhibitor-1/YccA family protein [Bdellovibrio sp. BCCA]|uniref:Bax inhibitor-1/YccA family protein n=1 Tax=Bdellovibrio sp. BCCA TaxID=3136281 RepID=UPI0030F24A6E